MKPDFTSMNSRRDIWEDRLQNILAWFHTEDAYFVVLLIVILVFAALRYN